MAADPSPTTPQIGVDFDQLLVTHAGRVYGFVHRLVGADQAEDLCQDVWVAIYRALPRYRGEAKVTTWMFTIAARTCERHRRRRRLVTVEEGQAAEVADESAGPEESALQDELRAIVREAIDLLPSGQREVVHLRQLEGLSYADIAAVLHIPIGTVRSRLFHGMAKLTDLLRPYLETQNETA